jgi:hypothetical protein
MRQGVLRRTGRGVYEVANAKPTEHHSNPVVTKEIPKGVVCLLSALRFHELTTQQPSECGLNDSRAGLGQPSRQFKPRDVAAHPIGWTVLNGFQPALKCPMKLVEGESLRVV